MSVRAFVIDLDGTLIGRSLSIDPADANAIARARNAGIAVWLATGRLLSAALPFARELKLDGPAIVLNGAAIYDLSDGRLVRAHPLARAPALGAYDWLKARRLHVQLYFGDDIYLDEENHWSELYLSISRVVPKKVANLRDMLVDARASENGPLKVLAVADPQLVLESIPLLARDLGGQAQVFRSQPEFLEVTDPSADKGQAIREVAALESIPLSDIAAIGDSDNDVAMFRLAGASFAVAGGTPAALASAGRVVAALGRGGVAEAIGLAIGDPVRG